MNYEYRMVQIPPTIVIQQGQQRGDEASSYLQSLANQEAAQGWEFYRVDTIGVITKPGCLGSLMGGKQQLFEYYVVTFRRETAHISGSSSRGRQSGTVTTASKRCAQCNADMSPDVAFCTQCGAKQ